MINADEGLLICDFAETYNILDYRALPLDLVATLAYGLRDDSRIKLKMASAEIDITTMLMASILDHLAILLWSKTNAQEGKNKPESILNKLLNVEEEKKTDVITFDTLEEFEEIRRRIIEEKS